MTSGHEGYTILKLQPEHMETHQHNTKENQAHYEAHKAEFDNQAKRLARWMANGSTFTTLTAMQEGIGHLPRRIKDIRDKLGLEVSADRMPGTRGAKVYYMNDAQREAAIRKFRGESVH